MFNEPLEETNGSDVTIAFRSLDDVLSRSYAIDATALGRMNNRLQACINLLHLLGTDGGLNAQTRLLVTHLTSEIALLRSILRQSIEPIARPCALRAAQ